MADPNPLNRLAPGFEFLQDLVKNAGAALPNIGQWIAPTLNPQEIAKRIEELRTVQFWLEQNARMIGATIQALEVQRMTLSTLQSMNVQMDDLRESLAIRPQAPAAGHAAPGSDVASAQRSAAAKRGAKPVEPAGSPAVDPTQWWAALTKQFTELAATAVTDSAKNATIGAAKTMAGNVLQQGLDAAGSTLKAAAGVPAAVARKAAATRRKPTSGAGRR
jgi:hypothetical protein